MGLHTTISTTRVVAANAHPQPLHLRAANTNNPIKPLLTQIKRTIYCCAILKSAKFKIFYLKM